MEPTPEELQPRRFGRYQLLHRFASGGMADVYLARLNGEEGFQRIMAIKVIHSHLTEQPEFVKMFIDEARLASRISHPNVALTLDLGRVGATHFIAMEYVDGESVTSVLRRTRPPLPYAMRIISDAAAGLHAAHELRGLDGSPLGVVHRDVSPANILIAYDGTVKVVDFGVARARGSLHTTSGGFKGKFGYMSPEQFSAPETVDRRTDIFALGVVLYEMTTWTRLFKCATEAETVERVLYREIQPPSARVEGYPSVLEAIVMRALSREISDRHATAQELHEELEHAIAKLGGPTPSSAIGKMMQEIFADRIAEKRLLLEQSSRNEVTRETEITPEPPSTSSVMLSHSVVTFPGHRRLGPVLAVLAGILAAGALLLWLALRSPGPGQPAATPARPDAALRTTAARRDLAPAPTRQVTISARATPARATITLGGKAMENPFELRQPAATGTIELVVSAPGHQTQRFEIPLDRGGTWSVGLVPERRGVAKPLPGKKPGRKQFLENPYK